MQLNDILTVQRTAYADQVHSAKQAFELLAECFCQANEPLDRKQLFDLMLARERLGSTGIGHGVAVPHIRYPLLTEPLAALLISANSISFDAPDNQPVNIFCGLIVPEEAPKEHLQLLSHIAKIFHDPLCREKIRSHVDAREIYYTAVEYASKHE